MQKMNWKIIAGNIKEAREQLEQIEKSIADKDYPAEGELLVVLEHAYHHLNFAWNARTISTKQYANLTDTEFNRWGQYPREISSFIVPPKTNPRSKSQSNKSLKRVVAKKRRAP